MTTTGNTTWKVLAAGILLLTLSVNLRAERPNGDGLNRAIKEADFGRTCESTKGLFIRQTWSGRGRPRRNSIPPAIKTFGMCSPAAVNAAPGHRGPR